MAPLINAFSQCKEEFDIKVCVTAQHRQMLDQVLTFFDIVPEYDLDIMKDNQDLFTITSEILLRLKPVLSEFAPDYVFVHGDTTTTMATSLACFYSGVKLCHVEAGLRTHNKLAPFPEEINRVITGRLADFHFAPTTLSRKNLIAENIPETQIKVTGNTVIDALYLGLKYIEQKTFPGIVALQAIVSETLPIVLVTGHRRENFGNGFINICEALKVIGESGLAQVIYPVHLNPNVKNTVFSILGETPNVLLIEPLAYPEFIWLMNKSKIIITDSGGIQEEAPSLGKPVLVMRDVTERPEAVQAGTVILVGTDKEKIIEETFALLKSNHRYERMARLHNPYGDGTACAEIIAFMKNL